MKILLSVITISAVLFLSSCKETNEKPQSQNETQPKTEIIIPTETVIAQPKAANKEHTAIVEEFIHTENYTYLRVTEAGKELWLAINKKDMVIGETIFFTNPMEMRNFRSKELKRTFETVYFLGGIRKESDSTKAKAPEQMPVVKAGKVVISSDEVHTGSVLEAINTTSYTYVKVKEGELEYWTAIPRRDMVIGEIISFENPMEMTNFSSKELKRTFERVYFLSGVKKASDSSDVKEMVAALKKAAEAKKFSVEKAEGGITVGELFENRDSYSGKVVVIRGKVTKFNQAIMGKNWVHLQDGTGGPGTNDILVTTQETAAVGDVVTFQGMVVLDKDFGAGYSYEVLVEMGKIVK